MVDCTPAYALSKVDEAADEHDVLEARINYADMMAEGADSEVEYWNASANRW